MRRGTTALILTAGMMIVLGAVVLGMLPQGSNCGSVIQPFHDVTSRGCPHAIRAARRGVFAGITLGVFLVLIGIVGLIFVAPESELP